MLLRNYIKYFTLPALQQAVSYKRLHNQVERYGLRKRTCDTVGQSAVLVAVCRFAAKKRKSFTNNTVNWTQSVTSFTDTIHALHVFDNNGLLATGLNYIKYVNPTGGVVLPSQPNSSALATVSGNMRAVYCHDHTDGYAAGDNYKWYTIEAVPDPVTKIWTGFTIASYTPADATL